MAGRRAFRRDRPRGPTVFVKAQIAGERWRYAGRVRDLTRTIQAVYDSEIDVTITMLCAGGIDFALCSSVHMCNTCNQAQGRPGVVWHHVDRADQLADAIHAAVLAELSQSAYARQARIH